MLTPFLCDEVVEFPSVRLVLEVLASPLQGRRERGWLAPAKSLGEVQDSSVAITPSHRPDILQESDMAFNIAQQY